VFTDFPQRIHSGKKVYLGQAHLPMTLSGVRPKSRALTALL